jgi:hypothetical protein
MHCQYDVEVPPIRLKLLQPLNRQISHLIAETGLRPELLSAFNADQVPTQPIKL